MSRRTLWRSYVKALGPGVITGSSDNDPAGISTYSVTGASTGYTFLWLGLVIFPLMTAVQEMAARIGAVRKEGFGQAIQDAFGRKWFLVVVVSLLITNVTTIGADLVGVSAGLGLLTHTDVRWFVGPVAALIVAVEVLWSYRMFERFLKYLTLVFFAYILAAAMAAPDWGTVLHYTFIPHIHWDAGSLAVMVGFLGTSISPYLFFWQASQEVEEIQEEERHPPRYAFESAKSERWRLIDTAVGMFYSSLIGYFVTLTAAATLHPRGVHIDSAAQAAQALAPIAGEYAYLLFAIGLIGAGLVAIPVLAGASAYPIAELLGCPEGLDRPLGRAKCFYTAIAISVAVGVVFAFLPIDPIQVLFYSQVLMGLLTPIILVFMVLIARNRAVMGGENTSHPVIDLLGWATIVIMSFANIALLWSLVTRSG